MQNLEAPYLHPRWEDQMALELAMKTIGTERVQRAINKSRQRQDMSNHRPYRTLLADWIGPLAVAIEMWCGQWASKRGVKPISLDRIRSVQPEVAAAVTLRSILRMLGRENRQVLAVAREIGTALEHEAQAALWEREDPEGWKRLQAHYRNRGSTHIHQRRSTISIWNKYVSDQMPWLDWTADDKYRVGLDLLGLVIETTRRFRIIPDPSYIPKLTSKGYYTKRPLVVEPDPELVAWLDDKMDQELFHAPAWMPTLMPPKEWEGVRGGGYWSPYIKTPPLIGFKAYHEETRQVALEEYAAIDMGSTYGAVNFIQNTPWAINKPVLEVAQQVWDKDLALAGIPRKEDEPIEAAPEVDRNSEEWKFWARRASETHARNAKRVASVLNTYRTISLATSMAEEECFHFPHRLDFRGRMYPIPVDLSPQGWDLHRGLLTFAQGKPIKPGDERWLAIHLANCHGVDKVPYDERIEWVRARKDRWQQIASDPMEYRMWTDADDPWQALAAILEWDRFLKEGYGMVSTLPIRVDGTCNGIQHLSAMIRDEVGGRAVNLVPGNRPRDIYQEVADEVTGVLKERESDHAAAWLDMFGGRTPRTITKRPVMILPYGGTRDAYFRYTMDWLAEHDPHCEHIPYERRGSAVAYIINVMWKVVGTVLAKAREVQKWLQECAMIAAKNSRPIWWRTPAGFHVRHFYGKSEGYRIRTRIDGQSYLLQSYRNGKELDTEAQARGIAPNFVHSMDASALMTCIHYARDAGIGSMTVIHDSYGTVAGDMDALTKCLREAFISTYREPVLENYLRACQSVASDLNVEWPAMPAMGSLDIEQIRQSEYFFA